MKIKTTLILGMAISLIFISVKTIFSQEAVTQGETAPVVQSELDMLWLWGEVIAVDPQNNTLLVKYLDYETDQEKELNINIDDKTTYENIKSLDEISPKDTVSIDYILSPDGKNTAKNISIEKPENAQGKQQEQPGPAPVSEAGPEVVTTGN